MKTKRFLLVIVGSCGLLSTERTLAQSVVYDNSTTYLGTAQPAHLEDGNEVTLGGSGRVVTSVAIAVEIAGDTPATVQAKLRLYANDSGYPGTLLWQSDLIPQQVEPGAPRFIYFAVPRVLVPNTFIWTAQFVPTDTQVSFSQFYPLAVGSVRYGYWWRNAGPVPWVFVKTVPPFGAVVTGEPEIPAIAPWGALLLTLALVGAGTVVISRRIGEVLLGVRFAELRCSPR